MKFSPFPHCVKSTYLVQKFNSDKIQNAAACLHFTAVCLHFQLFVLIFFSCLFTFLKITSLNSTFWQKSDDFSAVCLHFSSCLFTIFFSWQCKQKCKQTAENHEFKLAILAKKSWNFNVFASNSKSKQTADCLHF